MVERTKGRRPNNRPCDTKGRRPKKNDLRKEDLSKQLGCEGKGPENPGVVAPLTFYKLSRQLLVATLNCQLGFLVFSSGRQLDFSLRVWGSLQSSPARSIMILWPTARVNSGVTSSQFHALSSPGYLTESSGASFSESRRTARAPAECPRVRCLSLSVLPASWQFLLSYAVFVSCSLVRGIGLSSTSSRSPQTMESVRGRPGGHDGYGCRSLSAVFPYSGTCLSGAR